MTPEEAELRAYLERVDPPGKVVVRWSDESRIQPDPDAPDAFRVGHIAYLVLTAKVDGSPLQQRIDGIRLAHARRVLRDYPVDPLFRSDNIGR